MFHFFSHKKQNIIENQEDITVLNFRDLTLQNIDIMILPVGNDTLLKLREPKNNFEITLDKETCIVLSAILSEYGNTGRFNKIANLLTKGEYING